MLGRLTIIITVLALGLMPASAIATPQDIASTHAYILADFALARAGEASVGSTQASIVRLNQKLGRECPGAGVGSPETEKSQQPSYEVAGALWSVSYGADAGPIRAFVQAVKPLRWSNAKLTLLADNYAKSLHELATLPLPNLCGDVRAWSASGFQTIPATTIAFDRHVEAIEGHTIPPRLLAPYEQKTDKGILARTASLETKLEHTETVVGFDNWDLLLETLGLNQ